MLVALAEAALTVLRNRGSAAPFETGDRTWTFAGTGPEGMRFAIRLTGPDLPESIPETLIASSEIPKNPNWRGKYRLVVSPPNIALDLCWSPGEPLRIMTFSRGDWEAELLERARG